MKDAMYPIAYRNLKYVIVQEKKNNWQTMFFRFYDIILSGLLVVYRFKWF